MKSQQVAAQDILQSDLGDGCNVHVVTYIINYIKVNVGNIYLSFICFVLMNYFI